MIIRPIKTANHEIRIKFFFQPSAKVLQAVTLDHCPSFCGHLFIPKTPWLVDDISKLYLKSCCNGYLQHMGRSPQIYTAHKIWGQNLLAGVHCSLLVIPVGILTQFTKSINLTIILTWPNFYGTFKYHESHSNNHLFKCYWPGMTIYSLCNHFCNHKYHYDSIACLGVEIRFLIKKLWWKRCFYTVFQESPF